jgi:hypothetical protein
MSRGVKDLRELICVSRLSFREDDGPLEISCSSLPELELNSLEERFGEIDIHDLKDEPSGSRETRSAPVKRTVASLPLVSAENPKAMIHLTKQRTATSGASKYEQASDQARPQGIREELVAEIDVDRLGQLLSRTNSNLASLTTWWFDNRNACEFIHFWLKKLIDARQFELFQLEYSVVKKEIKSLFSRSLDTGAVKVSEVHHLLHCILHEYPDRFCGPHGRYFTVGAVEALLSGKNEEFRRLLTNVRHNSVNKPIIESILAIRSFGLISLVNSIVCFFCDAHELPRPTAGPLPKEPSQSILQTATALGFLDVVKYQWQRNKGQFGEVDVQGRSVIFLAVQQKQVKILKFLLEKSDSHPELDINKPASSGNTPLHAAVTAGDRECVQLLVDRGASVNQWNPQAEGATPLHLAVMYGECMFAGVSATSLSPP